ncbi:MAG: ribonuclease Z [archaeon]
MKIDLIFLGTSQAVPTSKRNHTAIFFKYKEESILVDCGEGTQRQFRIAGINPCSLTKILITHWHGDHILGIPGLLQTLVLNGYNKKLSIYGPQGTKRFMENIFSLFVFVGKINIEVIEASGKFFENKDFILEAFPLTHGPPCNAYSFTEKEKRRIDPKKLKKIGLSGPLVGKLQKGESIVFNGKKVKSESVSYIEKGKKISFVLDTSMNVNCIKAAKEADLAIIESSYSAEMKDKAAEYHHLTCEDAANIAKKANAKKLILTHVSQRHEKEEYKLLKSAKNIFPQTQLAQDFMNIEI